MDPLGERYAALSRRPALARLWEGSDLFNVGWWSAATVSVAEASAALVDQIARRLPDAGLVLDVGCGAGAGARLAAARPRTRVLALDRDLPRLAAAWRRRSAAAPPPFAAEALRLPVADRRVAAVVAIESAFHFDPRAAFFAEAARVLAPGGSLLLADFVVRDRVAFGVELSPAANRERDLADYAAALAGAGFAVVELEDVTDRTWRPFRRALARRAEAAEEAAARRHEDSVAAYLLARAVRR